jgi:hypothetical protein
LTRLLASAPTLSLLATLSAGCVLALSSTTPVTATIAINTTDTNTPVPPNFSGVSADLNLPVDYWDYRFNALAATIGFYPDDRLHVPERGRTELSLLATRRVRAGDRIRLAVWYGNSALRSGIFA